MKATRQECQSRGFWQIAFSQSVIKRALRVAILVGLVLAIINHGDRLLIGDIDEGLVLKILLTFFIPYSVSTYSSVFAIREFQNS
jgi:Mg/Co/Ni transporter MgtE